MDSLIPELFEMRQFPLVNICSEIHGKCCGDTPSGSAKYLHAKEMIEDGFISAKLKPGDTLIESTSGNLGASIAHFVNKQKYDIRMKFVVQPSLKPEVEKYIVENGGELHFVDYENSDLPGLTQRINDRNKLLDQTPNSWCPDQYRNGACIRAHFQRTGSELAYYLGDRCDAVVIPVGTGGTFSGCAKAIKAKFPGTRIVAVDEIGSNIFLEERKPRFINGMGSSYRSDELMNLDTELISEIRQVTLPQASIATDALNYCEKIPSGYSSGAALFAALTIVVESEAKSRVAVILPDGGVNCLVAPSVDEFECVFDPARIKSQLFDCVNSWHQNKVSYRSRDQKLVHRSQVMD